MKQLPVAHHSPGAKNAATKRTQELIENMETRILSRIFPKCLLQAVHSREWRSGVRIQVQGVEGRESSDEHFKWLKEFGKEACGDVGSLADDGLNWPVSFVRAT